MDHLLCLGKQVAFKKTCIELKTHSFIVNNFIQNMVGTFDNANKGLTILCSMLKEMNFVPVPLET